MNPTERSLRWLREQGWLPGVVERWNQFARVRQDLYGFVDVVAVKPGEKTLAIQACRGADVSTRLAKIRTHDPEAKPGRCPHCNARVVLAAGWRIVVHGWRLNAADRWVLREEEVTQVPLHESEVEAWSQREREKYLASPEFRKVVEEGRRR